METVSYVEVREELRITPAKVGRIRYLQETAVCSECRKDGGGTSAKASAPTALMPYGPASASAVAYVMFQRVFLGLPYYRQEPLAAQLGLTPPRETMANWCIYCAEHYLLPLYEKLHGLLQCDGNQGYNKVEDVVLVCCLAHCRREFYEAVSAQHRKNIKLLDILSEETIPEPILP